MDSVQIDLRVCEKEFFDCDAEELALKLLGKFLWCPQSNVGQLRILETEAYPVGDGVYKEIYGDGDIQEAIPDKPGVLFRLSAGLHHFPAPRRRPSAEPSVTFYPDHLYITAKTTVPETQFKSVVLIRSCMPRFADGSREDIDACRKIERNLGYTKDTSLYLRHNLLINPHAVAEAVSKDFDTFGPSSNPVLYEGGGCQLAYRADALEPVYSRFHGKRVLDLKRGTGRLHKYRFALLVPLKQYAYVNLNELELIMPEVPPLPAPLAGTSLQAGSSSHGSS